MPKVYLSPERRPTPHGPYWQMPGVYEHDVCCEIADLLAAALIRCGFEVLTGKQGDDIRSRVAEAVEWGADYYLPLHTNAAGSGAAQGTAQGPLVLAYGKKGGKSWRACQMVYDRLMQIYPRSTARGVLQNKSFYEINSTPMLSVYPELAFHDNLDDALWLVNHKREIAEALCRGVCDWYETAYVAEWQSGSPAEGWISLADHRAALAALESAHTQKMAALHSAAKTFHSSVAQAAEQFGAALE